MKRIIAIIIMLILLGAAANADPKAIDSPYFGKLRILGCKEYVTLRAEPSTASEALKLIPRNTRVDVEPYNDEFARVCYDGTWGYVLTDYLENDYEAPDYGYYMFVVNCNEWVSLRAEPSTDAPQLAKVPLDAAVWVENTENGFYGCLYNGMSGYILQEYLDYGIMWFYEKHPDWYPTD